MARPLEAAGHGAFTYFALGALRGWADGQVSGAPDGVVTAEEAQLYVQDALRSIGMSGQTPSLVGAGAESRVLATIPSTVRERGPELVASGGAAPVVPPSYDDPSRETPQRGTGSGTEFSVSTSGSRAEKLRQQECDDAAAAQGQASRDAALAAQVATVQAKATAAWQALSADASACPSLRDEKEREARARDVDAFVATARVAKASLSEGDESVKTACGTRVRSYAAVTVPVPVAELDAAVSLAAKIGAGPAAAVAVSAAVKPQRRRVTLTAGYWLMEHEVTQGEWLAVMGKNPSYFRECGSTCPVEQVSWDDAQAFAKKVSARDGVSYRLPTEAEWEYAARGGQSYKHAGSDELDDVGWYASNSGGKTHAACGKRRNGFGLCDMTGNVWEWTADWYAFTYSGLGRTDPTGVSAGSDRVLRGGSWGSSGWYAEVAFRYSARPGSGGTYIGLRLTRSGP